MRLDIFIQEMKKKTRLNLSGIFILLLFAALAAALLWTLVLSPGSQSVFVNSSGSPAGGAYLAPIPEPSAATKDRVYVQPAPLPTASPGSVLQGVSVEKTRSEQKYVPGTVIVRYKPTVSSDTINKSVQAVTGAVTITPLSGTGNQNIAIITLPAGSDVEDAAARIAQDPAVLSAQPNYLYQLAVMPNDPSFGLQWGLGNSGPSSGGIDGPDAWDITTGSTGTVIAVIDTGIDYNHPDLQSNIWTNAGETGTDSLGNDRRTNGIDDDSDGYVDDWRGWNFYTNTSDIMDTNGHGTAVSGIIGAAGNNGIGVSGTNWQVRVMPLDASNGYTSIDTASIIRAIQYAKEHGAPVISGSWGGYSRDPLLEDAISSNPDILFVFAAGNDAVNNDIDPLYPASYPFDNIISVAAINADGTLASYSNYGLTSVDIAAPGTLIRSTNRVAAGSYGDRSGTSMATPFVSGVAGLILAKQPGFSSSHLRNYILQSADTYGIYAPYVSTGGRLNAYNSLRALEAPVADFTANTTSGTAPLAVSFSDRSYAEISEWNWSFGDGNQSILANPVFTYEKPGNYSVSLSVKSPAGMTTVTKNTYIQVSGPLDSSLNVTKSASSTHLAASGPVTYTYRIENTGSGDIAAVTLTDDKLGVIAGPDLGDNGNGVLNPGETWTYSATTVLNETTTNIATVAGTAGSGGLSVQSNSVTVSVGALPVPEFPVPFFPVAALIILALISLRFRNRH